MPKIDLSFSGWVRGYDVKEVYDVETGEMIDVENVPIERIIANLDSETWAISLDDALANGHKVDCEVFDFDQSWRMPTD